MPSSLETTQLSSLLGARHWLGVNKWRRVVSAFQELPGSPGRKDINADNQAIKAEGQKQFTKG